jgi:16S rRNA U516 pseudouridylate synthase RsuA-like enzyme
MAPPRHRSSTDDIFTEPQRLHKVLASCGFGSRRAMEEMILAGRITVNREPADVGQKVGPGDEVRINGELVRVRFAEPRTRILMYHKQAGRDRHARRSRRKAHRVREAAEHRPGQVDRDRPPRLQLPKASCSSRTTASSRTR